MAKDLRGFIGELEVAQELIRVKEELSSQFEVPAAVKIIKNKYDKAILFERVRGYDVPVISNMLGSKEKLAMALGVRESEYEAAYLERKDTFIKPELKEKDLPGEVSIDKDVDILKVMPILTHSEKDAAPYLSSSFTVARDPETGMLGMGLHRIQVRSKDEINIWLLSPPLSIFLEKAEAMNQPLEVAVVNGVHPAVFMASVIKAPTGVNKFEMAGGLMQRPVEMIKCKTVDLEVPADAEFVLEGAILSHKKEKDGPFGESSGFYVATESPVAKIHLIRHRKDPIYQALLPFGGEDLALLNFIHGTELKRDARQKFPFIKDMLFKGLNYMVIVQIEKTADDQAKQIAEDLFKSPYIKVVVAVDTDIDLSSQQELVWAVCTRLRVDAGVHIIDNMPGHPIIDPSREGYFLCSKLLLDATAPLENRSCFEKIDVPPAIKTKIAAIIDKYL
jgi:2,5-furandicarboxylate decarboxylase 1